MKLSVCSSIDQGGGNRRPATLSAPIFLGLAFHRWRLRVFHLHPTVSAARAIKRPEPLGHNALAAEPAGVLEYDLAVALVVLIEHNAGMRGANQLGQLRLRSSIGLRRKSWPSSSIRSKAQSTASSPWRDRRMSSNAARPLSSVTSPRPRSGTSGWAGP
jgi:hypothetical protein